MSNLLGELVTEQRNLNTTEIDTLSSQEIVELIHEEDRLIPEAIRKILPQIAAAVDLIVDSFRRGGRLFYVGAGTSGRLGILDASECPPTFGTPPSMVQGIIAGGFQAVKDPVEGAEDSEALGASDIDAHGITADDVVVGIAASGRTPYVLGALTRARSIGAATVGLCNNHHTPMAEKVDLILEAVAGPEVILGSTRMKSGTAQKLVLNMLTTASMIRIGKVYQNLMVDLQPTNEKLLYRAKRIIAMATGALEEQVDQAFEASGHQVKTAIVMIMAEADCELARRLLAEANGFVREAVALAEAERSLGREGEPEHD